MKYSITILFIFFITFNLFGQDTPTTKLPPKDFLHLTNTWALFKKALQSKDRQTLHHLSLKYIYCDIFQPLDFNNITPTDSHISIDTFLKQFFDHMPKSKLWSVVKTNKYHYSVEKEEYLNPANTKSKKEKSRNVYEIWFVTWKPNELQKGHEGQTHAFQFVKANGEFRFYGMTSIP